MPLQPSLLSVRRDINVGRRCHVQWTAGNLLRWPEELNGNDCGFPVNVIFIQ